MRATSVFKLQLRFVKSKVRGAQLKQFTIIYDKEMNVFS